MSLVLDDVSRSVNGAMHLRNVSLSLDAGSLTVLLGATLSGKTSLLRVMAGLDVPSAGRVVVNGRDVTGVGVGRRNVAMVYQQFINYPAMTVFENIASPLRVAGVSRAETETRVREAARLLKLEPYLARMPLTLSGGQQQRTAVARALVKRAELVLMDEPLANLDYKLREELREELPKIFAASGSMLVYATTEPTEALLLGGSTATLFEGRVTQFGPTAEVFRQPRDLQTAQVFSDPPLNTLSASMRQGGLSLAGLCSVASGALPAALPDGDYTVGFRPHHLLLVRPAAPCAALETIVSVVEISGSESFVHVTSGEHRMVALAHGIHRFEPGQPVTLYLEPSSLFFFSRDGRMTLSPALARAA